MASDYVSQLAEFMLFVANVMAPRFCPGIRWGQRGKNRGREGTRGPSARPRITGNSRRDGTISRPRPLSVVKLHEK